MTTVVTAAAPIERVKLNLQCQQELVNQMRVSQPYKGALDCVRRVISEEGVGSLWRGNLLNLVRYFPNQVMGVIAASTLNSAFSPLDDAVERNAALRVVKHGVVAGLVGTVSLFVVTPLDYGRTRLANNLKSNTPTKARQFNGFMDVLLRL